jgi:hypothetical protein
MLNNHAFRPGEVVWYTRDQHTYTKAMVAPADVQSPTIGKITLVSFHRGLLSADIGFVHHDSPELAAYIVALKDALAVEHKTKEYLAKEGLTWGGKSCRTTKPWLEYTTSEERVARLLAPVREADNAAMRANQAAAKAG